jgi:hypothetical protein
MLRPGIILQRAPSPILIYECIETCCSKVIVSKLRALKRLFAAAVSLWLISPGVPYLHFGSAPLWMLFIQMVSVSNGRGTQVPCNLLAKTS